MKIYLAGPHSFLRHKDGFNFALQVFSGYEDIFSRRKQQKENNNGLMGGENCVKQYLNENISVNSWGGTGMPEPYRRLLENNADIFSGGGSLGIGCIRLRPLKKR